jgi:hypothetical protein
MKAMLVGRITFMYSLEASSPAGLTLNANIEIGVEWDSNLKRLIGQNATRMPF